VRLPGGDLPARLSDQLHALDYTVEGVRSLLGTVAAEALDREEIVPAGMALAGDDSPLATAVRLFLLGHAVPPEHIRVTLGIEPRLLDDLLVPSAAGVPLQAAVELAPYGTDADDWLVASDWSVRRSGRPTASDHVLGVGGASTMLAQCTVRPKAERALDIGTGCGVQALHLAGHSRTVVATDISPRCLELAAFNAALNGVAVDLRAGSLFEPVQGESFDLIVSNPPFVIGSPDAGHHTYRDSGMQGDAVCGRLVAQAEAHLAEGGWCQLLANWEVTDGDDWSARPREWLDGTGLDAWVVQRDVQDPASYVETWLRDAGEHHGDRYRDLYEGWLVGLQRRGVLGVGFGLVTVRRGRRDTPIRRFQHVDQPWVQPVAPDVERWFAVHDQLADDPTSLLRLPLTVAADVVAEQHRALGEGAAPYDPVSIVRRTSGMAWMAPIDDFGLAVLEQLDGERPAAQVVGSVAQAWAVDVETALSGATRVLWQLAQEGFVRW
jgi:methylase of polypeptide subunit release factors